MMSYSLPRQVAVCLHFSGNEILFADQGATPVCNLCNQNRKKNSYPGTDGKYLLVLCHRDLECLSTNTVVALQPHTASSLPLLCAFAHSKGFLLFGWKDSYGAEITRQTTCVSVPFGKFPKKSIPHFSSLYSLTNFVHTLRGLEKHAAPCDFTKGAITQWRLSSVSQSIANQMLPLCLWGCLAFVLMAEQ